MNRVQSTYSFRMGVLGAMAEARFAARIDALALKPKHVGLMLALETGGPAVQLDIARRLGVAPSLVVSLADHLEALSAIQRVRDQDDRRRQLLSITGEGRRLLGECAKLAAELDEELTEGLGEAEREALDGALRTLAARAGLPT
ncbi:MarR family winged helix-turn-helix transcriptional regulator [Nonomuraea sp. NPDC050536]|uniref:MarR family winged helix-turn-helix transcriptional regulator n=1 Tax=Nonomuraea sp. NPDC050536 TaxID=3364366 RepID=UPI0037CC5812